MIASLLLLALTAKPAEPAAKPKVIASASWDYAKAGSDTTGKDAQTLVLKTAADLVKVTPFNNLDALPAVVEKQATAALAKALKVKTIDWKTQMLVVVTAGTQPSGGYRVLIKDLAAKDKTLTVKWQLLAPKGAATAVLTHPGAVALVPAHAGKVAFEKVK